MENHRPLLSLQCVFSTLQANLSLLESFQAGTSFDSRHLQNVLCPSGTHLNLLLRRNVMQRLKAEPEHFAF